MADNADRFRYIMHKLTKNEIGGDSLYTRMAAQPLYKENQMDTELEHKARRVSEKFSENLNIIANEPSLAFFRIQEHVRKTLPQLVDQKHEIEDVHAKVQGACFDAEYATNAVKAMSSSAIHFENIQDLVKNAMFMKQQISYEENRRKLGQASPSVSPKPGAHSQGDKSASSASAKQVAQLEAQPGPSVQEKPVAQQNTVSTSMSDECLEVEQILSLH